jgi:glycosyltransferase involved in cell wall biosynthesis
MTVTHGAEPAELVVFSHLRWTFVWQRPQHLLSRLAQRRPVWFVEEPVAVAGLARPILRREDHGPVRRVWLEVPGEPGHVCFSDDRARHYVEPLRRMLADGVDRGAWLYTPMALPLVDDLGLAVLAYDVMDDLASFAGASPELRQRQLQALGRASVVFTGGRSLHCSALQHRRLDIHCFPSGVEPTHYAPAIERRVRRARPVAGYVGVIDERLDLELLHGLAERLPEWQLQMVGPVVKIDECTLPVLPNVSYMGAVTYDELPTVMAGLDVALMPFARNEATRSISPTKTLEYLAAGLPVVSTRVPDVVTDFSTIVDLEDDADGFAGACRRAVRQPDGARAGRARALLDDHDWDTIARRMDELLLTTGRQIEAGLEASA